MRKPLPASNFIQVWQAYQTFGKVQRVLGWNRQYILRRMRDLRGRGIKLKYQPGEELHSPNALDVARLIRQAIEAIR